ncbi:MAG: arginine--tRNA ligase [bacterium JZ-2024 1]
MRKYLFTRLQEELTRILQDSANALGLPLPEEIPLKPFSFSEEQEKMTGCRWGMSSTLPFLIGRHKASELAQKWAEHLSSFPLPPSIHSVEAKSGYLNFSFSTPFIFREGLKEIHLYPDYGAGEKKSTRYMVEFSQPNTHKAFHIGHLRNVVLGNALVNILRFYGFPVISANYIGDSGAHILLCLWNYQKKYLGKEPEKDRGKWLGSVYAEAAQAMAAQEEDALRALYRILQNPCMRQKVENLLGPDESLSAFLPSLSLSEEEFVKQSERHSYILSRILEKFRERKIPGQENISSDARKSLEEFFSYQEELKRIAQKWEEKDPELLRHWKRTRQWSLEEFQRIYEELDVQFDVWFYESEMEEEGKKIVQELLEKGIAEIRNGAVVVDLAQKTGNPELGVLVLLRSDGSALYSTKDLALARKKIEEYGVEQSVYVVASPQTLYFRQLFTTLELAGMASRKNFFHLSYEVVMLPEGLISSRLGRMVLYDDLARLVREMAREIVNRKNPDMEDSLKEKIATTVALGALKFEMLSREKEKVIVFRPEEALSFEGYSAPYLQYVVARCKRIKEKAPFSVSPEDLEQMNWEIFHPGETALLNTLLLFPKVIQECVEKMEPFYLCQGLYEIARAFSAFYHTCPVIHSEKPLALRRLWLVEATEKIMSLGLSLLGIRSLERM